MSAWDKVRSLFGWRGRDERASTLRNALPGHPIRETGGWTATGYHVVREAARDGNLGTAGSGKQHERPDRTALYLISRELYRDNLLYSGIINRAADYTVGSGFNLQLRSGDPDWDSEVEKWWKRFWSRPDAKGDKSGPGVERMMAKELYRCGEATSLLLKSGKLQLIEAEQIVGLGLNKDGITRNEEGAATEYSIAPYQEYGGVDVARAVKRAAQFVLHAVDPDRPSSSRGVPPCNSTFSQLRRVDSIFNSEALARDLQSRLAIAITKEGGPQWGKNASKADTSKTGAEGDPAARLLQIDRGLIYTGKPGDKVESLQRSAPGANFEAELIPFLRSLGGPLGIPLELLFMDWTKTNYSQSRAILEQAYLTFARWQCLLKDFFLTPVFQWALERAIVAGEFASTQPDDYLAHEWIVPAWPWIDALKEAQAYGEQLDRGLATHAQVLKQRNIDRGDYLAQRKREVIDGIKVAQEIEKETGVKVDPKMFYGQKSEPAQQATEPEEKP